MSTGLATKGVIAPAESGTEETMFPPGYAASAVVVAVDSHDIGIGVKLPPGRVIAIETGTIGVGVSLKKKPLTIRIKVVDEVSDVEV